MRVRPKPIRISEVKNGAGTVYGIQKHGTLDLTSAASYANFSILEKEQVYG